MGPNLPKHIRASTPRPTIRLDHSTGQHDCTHCGSVKGCAEFDRRTRSTYPGQHESSCTECRRKVQKANSQAHRKEYGRHDVVKGHGLTMEQYNQILEGQDSLCAICRRPNQERLNRALHIDHNHETGRIRGLLCSRCNNGLGLFGDGRYLAAAMAYIEAYQ